jgi:hemerythrin-like domain-containing protein
MEKCKPIKRSKAFVQFSKDHHFALLLVWKIRQDLTKEINGSEISRYVHDFFRDDLQQHFKEEEKFIFSKLSVADPLRLRAESEHRKIYTLIESIQQNTTDKDLLHQFADLLETHIRFEERTLFNHLQQQMSAEELEQLLQHTASTKATDKSNKLFEASK